MLTVKIRDLSAEVIEAVQAAASYHHGDLVTIDAQAGDAMAGTADAIVSPANSFGFMDGGIDLAISYRFGWELQERVQACIRQETRFAELLVGDALCVPTFDKVVPNLIVAPTMRVPMVIVDPNVVFMATRAAVRCAMERSFESIILSGMGTGVGRIRPDLAAAQMIGGINEAVRPPDYPVGWSQARERHFARQIRLS